MFGVLLTPGLASGQTVEVPNLNLDAARAATQPASVIGAALYLIAGYEIVLGSATP